MEGGEGERGREKEEEEEEEEEEEVEEEEEEEEEKEEEEEEEVEEDGEREREVEKVWRKLVTCMYSTCAFCIYLFRKILLVDRDLVTPAGRMGSSRQNCSR